MSKFTRWDQNYTLIIFNDNSFNDRWDILTEIKLIVSYTNYIIEIITILTMKIYDIKHNNINKHTIVILIPHL